MILNFQFLNHQAFIFMENLKSSCLFTTPATSNAHMWQTHIHLFIRLSFGAVIIRLTCCFSHSSSGFTAVQKKDYLSVFQLTETGDIFYQTLKLHTDQPQAVTTYQNNLSVCNLQ